ncbi:MAG: TatD family hydrolase [Anaerolineae bacterium]|nr:TatD family hydrolase [Anaerolineae bacterium]
MLVDTHIHLQDQKYVNDIDQVLERAVNAGVGAVIVPGTTLQDSIQAVVLAEKYRNARCRVYAAVGIHPTEAHTLTPAALAELHTLAQNDRVVAVGEIGLDYYWPNNTNRTWQCAEPPEQRQAFISQLNLAHDLSLPVIVHNRNADDDTMAFLADWHTSSITHTGVLHSYSGGLKRLTAVIELGFFISVGGRITYKNAHELRNVAEAVPNDRYVIETDGPYLAPVPFRGKRNEPKYLPYTASRIALVKGVDVDSIERKTTQNALSLFGLDIKSTI